MIFRFGYTAHYNPILHSHKITDSQITPIKSPNISCVSTVLDTGIPKSDGTKMDLEVQDTTQNPMPKKVIETELPYMSLDSKFIETEAPKDDMMTVDLNTLDPKPNPMPKKTMTPRHKVKIIKKNGKIQIIQFPGVHKMKFKSSHKITDSHNTPIESPNISCGSTVS